jgi:hypothetical protein
MCEASFARQHALYAQIFQPDELVFINQPAADLMVIVAAWVGNLLVQTGQPQTRLLTVAAAEFLAGQLAGKAASPAARVGPLCYPSVASSLRFAYHD